MSLETLSLIAIVIGYLLGSVPFGLLLTKIAGKGDIRDIGSGNIGATNVLRSGSKLLALLTLVFDALKGVVAVQLAIMLAGEAAMYGAGLACFVGHLFPVWLRFKGGKGIATLIGLLLIMSPLTGLVFLVSWLLMAVVFRYSSLAALTSVVLSLPLLALLGENRTLVVVLVMAALTFYAHRENIKRLIDGTESRIGQK